MEKFFNIMIAATAGYYAQKALATKNDAVNIATAVMVTATINHILNSK
jgi:hypothetical protein